MSKNIIQGKVAFARPSIESDIEYIAENMRESDKDELRGSLAADPYDALREGLERSGLSCWTVVIGDEPIAMFGVAPDPACPFMGCVWFRATDRLDECREDIRNFSPHVIIAMMTKFNLLGCMVDERNTESIRWLEYLGFKAMQDRFIGKEGFPCVVMIRIKTNV